MQPIEKKPEAWQRGPIPEIPGLLQPVAHALVQATEEVEEMVRDFPDDLLWEKPAGMASVGFHLMHLSGVADRLFTYARGEQLSDGQREFLKKETIPNQPGITAKILAKQFNQQVNKCLDQLRQTNESTLTEFRGIGRKQIPTNVLGLLFHTAEHTMRHTGQLLVTVGVLKNQ